MRAERKKLDARIGQLDAQLSASDEPDPLPEFRDPVDDMLAVWDSLGIVRQRAVVQLLCTVQIMPCARKGGRFDPDSVRITRRVRG